MKHLAEFVPSPAAGSPVITSVQPGSGVFVPSPANASFVQTSVPSYENVKEIKRKQVKS